jgi:hypothetical protein
MYKEEQNIQYQNFTIYFCDVKLGIFEVLVAPTVKIVVF